MILNHFLRTCLTVALVSASAALCHGEGPVDFAHDVLPILNKHCAECHTNGKYEGGLSMDTRDMLLEAEVVAVGQSDQSGLIERILSNDPEQQMPPEGARLTATEVTTLRNWIDGGLTWERGFTFRKFPQAPLEPRAVTLPPATASQKHPVDRLLSGYFTERKVAPNPAVDDRTFARRLYLDLNGLLPPVDELEDFVTDKSPEKRTALVERLLGRRQAYTEHWLTFWSDMLRNAYRGTGYIDGGRSRIDSWLYAALYENKPYDEFVHELITGSNGSAGFINGIKWRGNVNESQRHEMQAAQNVGQVFMGTNLKCASCHDSFVNQWKLADSYALASVFASDPLELHRCDKPTGTTAETGFLYPQLGTIDAKAPRAKKMRQLANLIVQPENGRLARTIVNRLWAQFMGRGIVEPVDDMDQQPFSSDLLDWLAADLVEHDYDLKRTMHLVCTSRAYQSRSVGAPRPDELEFVYRGPIVKRMNAEMFADAISMLTGDWPTKPVAKVPNPSGPTEPPIGVRAALLNEDSLTRTLGRPNREQVVTQRESVATTLQAIELTNGKTLDTHLKHGATRWLTDSAQSPETLIDNIYLTALGRRPTDTERAVAAELVGDTTQLPKIGPAPVPMWIWAAGDPEACILDKQFPGGATAARLVATCDNHMTVYLNGQQAATSDKWESPVQADVSQMLLPGDNRIRVEAANGGGPAGFVLKLVLTMPDGSLRYVVTDDSWQAITDQEAADESAKAGAPVKVLGRMGAGPWGDVFPAPDKLVVSSPQADGIADLLWALTMLPEFQLIH